MPIAVFCHMEGAVITLNEMLNSALDGRTWAPSQSDLFTISWVGSWQL